jgi:hypothetical protein
MFSSRFAMEKALFYGADLLAAIVDRYVYGTIDVDELELELDYHFGLKPRPIVASMGKIDWTEDHAATA